MGLCLSRNFPEKQGDKDKRNRFDLKNPTADQAEPGSCLLLQHASTVSIELGAVKAARPDCKIHHKTPESAEPESTVAPQPSASTPPCSRKGSPSHLVGQFFLRERSRRHTDDTAGVRSLGSSRSFSSRSLPEEVDLAASGACSSTSALGSYSHIKVIQLSKNTTVWTWDLERQQKQLFLGNEADALTFIQRHGPAWEDPEATLVDPTCRPDTVNSGYAKLRKLGAGSFGKVLLVELEITGELYAMKVFNKAKLKRRRYGLASSALDSCMREASLFKQLRHPNVVELYEVMDDDGKQRTSIVMEYMHKGPCQLIDHPVALPVERCRRIMWDVVSALVYLHGKAVVHGDIKPENILLNASDVAKLSDFGCAQLVQDTDGMVSRSPGTPGYTAPECLCNDTYDGYAADMWALGITLFTMITGSHPFKGCSQYSELSEQIKNTNFKIPREILDSPVVDNFLEWLLDIDPEERLTADQAIHHPFILDKQSNRIWNLSSSLPTIASKKLTLRDSSKIRH